uniref:NAD(+) ADP-ribosyltransferase n=1 Tax=Ditylenchus dipsaci TaxID=166011 RepID=A0A915EH78_9BILA
MKVVDKQSEEFALIEKYAENTRDARLDSYKLDIVNLDRVYEAEKSKGDTGNTYLLWHGPRISNYVVIFKQAIPITPPEAPVVTFFLCHVLKYVSMRVNCDDQFRCFSNMQMVVNCLTGRKEEKDAVASISRIVCQWISCQDSDFGSRSKSDGIEFKSPVTRDGECDLQRVLR